MLHARVMRFQRNEQMHHDGFKVMMDVGRNGDGREHKEVAHELASSGE